MRVVREQERKDQSAQLAACSKKYIVLSAHREENIDNEKNFNSLMNAVNAVAEQYQMPIIFSTHPRSRKQIEERGFVFNSLVKSIPPLGFNDYVNLQKNAFCVLSDSGTLSEESAMLNFPAVLIRTSTERPEAIDKGTITIGGITSTQILQAISISQSTQHTNNITDYQDTNVSTKVIKIIQSYTSIINHNVWRKQGV